MSSSSCPFHTCLSLCMYKCMFMEMCICVEHQRTQISRVILRKIINCLETVLLQGLSLSWNSVRRTGWPASGLSDSPVSTFSALGLAVCVTTPGMLIWGSGNEAQALMLARQVFYQLRHPPPQVLSLQNCVMGASCTVPIPLGWQRLARRKFYLLAGESLQEA